MNLFFTYIILSATAVLGNIEAQADRLFDMVNPQLYDIVPKVELDASGNLWMVALWHEPSRGYRCDVTKIKPDASIAFERKPLLDEAATEKGKPSSEYVLDMTPNGMITSDRFGSLYVPCSFSYRHRVILDQRSYTSVHLIRVSSDGSCSDYYPWPNTELLRFHMEIVDADTMVICGVDAPQNPRIKYIGRHAPFRISTASVSSSGLTPAFEKVYEKGNFPSDILSYGPSSGDRNYNDWKRGYGFRFFIRNYTPGGDTTEKPVNLYIRRFDLRASETSIPAEELGTYKWRDYVWRTFRNAYIGYTTVANYKDGGYMLYLPDPLDYSTTHVIRLDYTGIPIDPATLDDGGEKKSLAFKRLPADQKPNVYFALSRGLQSFMPDSGCIYFWGTDNEGNLYNYRKVHNY